MHPNLTHRDFLTQRQLDSIKERTNGSQSSGLLRRWLHSAHRKWQRRKMIAALEAMDDRLLRDIGIYRGDIPRVVDSLSDRELRMTPMTPSANPDETCDDLYRKAA